MRWWACWRRQRRSSAANSPSSCCRRLAARWSPTTSSRRWCAISCNRSCRDENRIAGTQLGAGVARRRGRHEAYMSSTASNLLLAILLLAANAFYGAAEFALVKGRGFRIKAMVEQDRFGARLLHGMMGNIEAYLACCQLGITMASLGLGWVGEPTVSALLEPVLVPLGLSERTLHFVSFMAGFLVFSSLHIVIGEQVPKTLAIRQPMPVSQWIAYPLQLSFLLLYPLNWLLNAASRSILRMLGVKEGSEQEILTDSEIEGLVEESAVHGGIESGEAEYIHNVFRFGDLAVSDVMVHRTAMVLINADCRRTNWCAKCWRPNTPAFRCGAKSRKTSSGCCMPRIC